MLKSAWLPAKNPDQQLIREAKALWNVKMSSYITDFIELKKMFNGQSSKFNEKPLSLNLSDEDIANFADKANALSQVFNKLIIEEIKRIIQSQNTYALNRTKSNEEVKQAGAYESIIKSKKEWNSKAKDFISTLIEFKKLVNGLENKFIPQKTKIHEQFKGNPDKLIDILDNFNKSLISYAVKILQNQKNIKKSSDAFNSFIEKYGSNPLNRLWSGITNLPESLFGNKDDAKLKEFHSSFIMNFGALKSILRDIEAHIIWSKNDDKTDSEIDDLSEKHTKIVKLIEIYSIYIEKLSTEKYKYSKLLNSKINDPDTKQDSEVEEVVKPEPAKPEPAKPEVVKPEPTKLEAIKPEEIKPEPTKLEAVKQEVNNKPVVDKNIKSTKKVSKPTQDFYNDVLDIKQDAQFLRSLLPNISNLLSPIIGKVTSLIDVIEIESENFFKKKDPALFAIVEDAYSELVDLICKTTGIKFNGGSEVFHAIYKQLENLEKNKKTASYKISGLLNNPFTDYVGQSLNKLKFWKTDSAIRNHVSDQVENKRKDVDELLNEIQSKEIIDVDMLDNIRGFIGNRDPWKRHGELSDSFNYISREEREKRKLEEKNSMYMFIRELKDTMHLIKNKKAK